MLGYLHVDLDVILILRFLYLVLEAMGNSQRRINFSTPFLIPLFRFPDVTRLRCFRNGRFNYTFAHYSKDKI